MMMVVVVWNIQQQQHLGPEDDLIDELPVEKRHLSKLSLSAGLN